MKVRRKKYRSEKLMAGGVGIEPTAAIKNNYRPRI